MSYGIYQSNLELISSWIDSSLLVEDFQGHASVNGYVALPLKHASPKYASGELYEISLEQGSNAECFLLKCSGHAYNFTQESHLFVAAFLKELKEDKLPEITNTGFIFENDHLVIRSDLLELYTSTFKESSELWGGFSHTAVPPPRKTLSTDSLIRAKTKVTLPTQEHNLALLRANNETNALGRYLALFHLLELSFDYDLVQEIKQLGNDLRGIGKLLAAYNHAELSRLNRLVSKYWINESTLIAALGKFFTTSPHDDLINEIIFDYEKDGFPWAFKDNPEKRNTFKVTARAEFSKTSFETARLGWTSDHLQKAAAYIVYRFRCAIAHASIGEFIIGINDEEFVSEKAEPLLSTLIWEVYKNPTPP